MSKNIKHKAGGKHSKDGKDCIAFGTKNRVKQTIGHRADSVRRKQHKLHDMPLHDTRTLSMTPPSSPVSPSPAAIRREKKQLRKNISNNIQQRSMKTGPNCVFDDHLYDGPFDDATAHRSEQLPVQPAKQDCLQQPCVTEAAANESNIVVVWRESPVTSLGTTTTLKVVGATSVDGSLSSSSSGYVSVVSPKGREEEQPGLSQQQHSHHPQCKAIERPRRTCNATTTATTASRTSDTSTPEVDCKSASIPAPPPASARRSGSAVTVDSMSLTIRSHPGSVSDVILPPFPRCFSPLSYHDSPHSHQPIQRCDDCDQFDLSDACNDGSFSQSYHDDTCCGTHGDVGTTPPHSLQTHSNRRRRGRDQCRYPRYTCVDTQGAKSHRLRGDLCIAADYMRFFALDALDCGETKGYDNDECIALRDPNRNNYMHNKIHRGTRPRAHHPLSATPSLLDSVRDIGDTNRVRSERLTLQHTPSAPPLPHGDAFAARNNNKHNTSPQHTPSVSINCRGSIQNTIGTPGGEAVIFQHCTNRQHLFAATPSSPPSLALPAAGVHLISPTRRHSHGMESNSFIVVPELHEIVTCRSRREGEEEEVSEVDEQEDCVILRRFLKLQPSDPCPPPDQSRPFTSSKP